MAKCRWIPKVERWFDNQGPLQSDPAQVVEHIDQCPVCAAHLAQLQTLRQAVDATIAHEEIRDAQFPAFMEGIRERIQAPVHGHRRAWTVVSLTLAALIVAVSAFLVVTGGLDTVDATVVESCSSDVEGAMISTYLSGKGVTTVWVTESEDDAR